MRKYAAGTLLMLLAAVFCLNLSTTAAAEDNVGTIHLYGTLLELPPCIINGGDDIEVDFNSTGAKDLYDNTRTWDRIFTIQLEDCDTTNYGLVSTTFTGPESSELPGYLQMEDTSTGAAIGIAEQDGTFLGLNKTSTPTKLTNGSVALVFKAFLQGEPTALANHTIQLGEFRATSTFILTYQ